MFDHLKNGRRVATRYDRGPTAFFSANNLATATTLDYDQWVLLPKWFNCEAGTVAQVTYFDLGKFVRSARQLH